MRAALTAAAIAAAGAAAAAFVPAAAQLPASERITRMVVYGDQPCPTGTGDEIIVCARRPGGERYRIPEALRDEATADDPENTSWAVHADALEYVGRTGIQSCSPVGPAGHTGCFEELVRAARNERARTGEAEPGR